MLEGTNPSSFVPEDIYDEYIGAGDAKTVQSVLEDLKRRRENVLAGGTNCIPLPFKKFRSEVPGIEQGQYVVVTANQKTGKTNFADFVYVFSALDYAFENKDKCSVHIIYFPLEESEQKILERYMCYLLYKLDGVRIAPTDLRSTSSDFPVENEILALLESERYQERLRFFEECVQFETENTNPTGILRVCEEYAKSVGTYKSHKVASKTDFTKEIDVFDSYEQNDPNHYKIVVIDHIGLVDREQGFKLKDSVDKTSEYFVKYLRNRYKYTCVAIQQQAAEIEGLEAIKMKKMVPTASSLGDSKYTARDADLVLGLFDPSRFGLGSYLGYTISDADGSGLQNYSRFLNVIANRNGEMGGICPLFFDGAVCHFEELPRPDDINAITMYYNEAKNRKSHRQQRKMIAMHLVVNSIVTDRKKQKKKNNAVVR